MAASSAQPGERAFVAGATGYVGQHVVRELRGRGVETVAHIRPGSSQRSTLGAELEELGATIAETAWEPDAMAAALAEIAPTIVFSLLGTTRKRAKRDGETGDPYDKIDFGLTELLYAAAAQLERPPRFVYLSAAGVSDSSKGAYMRARVKAEAMLKSGSLPYVIARPAIITGADRDESRPAERAGAVIGDGLLAVAGVFGARRLRARYRSTTGSILARALVTLALAPGADDVVAEGDSLR